VEEHRRIVLNWREVSRKYVVDRCRVFKQVQRVGKLPVGEVT